jgi:hypothetical protein
MVNLHSDADLSAHWVHGSQFLESLHALCVAHKTEFSPD